MKKVNLVLAFVVMSIFIFASCEKETSMNKAEDTVKLEESIGVELSKVSDNYILDGITGTLYQTVTSEQDIFIANESMEKNQVAWEHTTHVSGGVITCDGEALDCKIYSHGDGVMIRTRPGTF